MGIINPAMTASKTVEVLTVLRSVLAGIAVTIAKDIRAPKDALEKGVAKGVSAPIAPQDALAMIAQRVVSGEYNQPHPNPRHGICLVPPDTINLPLSS